MDYLQQSLLFKLQKVIRYVRLYGPSRTRIKVLGQLHMRRQYTTLPPMRDAGTPGQNVALIGCGNYAFSNIAHYLTQAHGAVIASCMDIDINRAASLAQRFRVPRYGTDATEMLADDHLKIVYIASNHASHAEYAIQALERGKDVYIEKPHVISYDQLDRLAAAMARSPGRIFLGFNRPGSRFGELVLKYLGREQGAGMYNWFVAGHAIEPDHWYNRPEEGGRVLGNLCHWTDFVLKMAGSNWPVTITPIRGTKADSDVAVTFTFADETIAVISFSAKGHTFEGVKEHLSAHRGNCLISMTDYETLSVEVGEVKRRYRNVFRDHGHKRNILVAYEAATGRRPYSRAAMHEYVKNTAWLFLKTRDALDTGRPLTVHAYDR